MSHSYIESKHLLSNSNYHFLPFRFERFPNRKILLVNEAGEYLFLTSDDFEKLVEFRLDKDSDTYMSLLSRQFIYDNPADLPFIIDSLATKYRTKHAFLNNFTALHMIVVTLRCNHRCKYCQASSRNIEANKMDMSVDIARKVVDMIFAGPSSEIKIEFQGGEPLLNFDAVREIIIYAQRQNKKHRRKLSFVLCTNLTLINSDILHFLKKNDVCISTSLDGPQDIHDSCRIMRSGDSSYKQFINKLNQCNEILGGDKVSALMTITNKNIHRLNDVINEYLQLGFSGIFLRPLNPYGYALDEEELQYSMDRFVDAYCEAINYLIELNMNGTFFVEYFAQLILTRILTPFSTGFMDLQSPAGTGILGVIYNYNGDVFPSDEARMLAEMGDSHFRLGNVQQNNFYEIFAGEKLKSIIHNSCVEIIPGCHSCALQRYCGSDPIRSYSQQGDTSYIGHIPTSHFCKKHKKISLYFMKLIEESNDKVLDVFWSWITHRPVGSVKL